jgi:hypothetical protein
MKFTDPPMNLLIDVTFQTVYLICQSAVCAFEMMKCFYLSCQGSNLRPS